MIPKLQALLESNGVSYDPFFHRRAYTSQEAAEAEHVKGREHAKVAMVKTSNGYLMAVLPAPRKVDVAKLRRALGDAQADLALEIEFERLFPDCETGAMPPFGNLFGLETIVDPSLAEDDVIAFQAGTHHESVRMKFSDFERLAKPRRVSFAA